MFHRCSRTRAAALFSSVTSVTLRNTSSAVRVADNLLQQRNSRITFYSIPRTRTFSSVLVPTPIDESEFHEIADETLEELIDCFVQLEEQMEDFDFELTQGVLNITCGSKNISWVINKQTPNRQLWWSSPISGPRRYEWVEGGVDNKSKVKHAMQWVNSREGGLTGDNRATLFNVLRDELLQVTGIDIKR